ncbi:MAG: hypothetical protein EHM41_15285 [Chloroflexi bacterium]|nr:MAG: hypothetical protein EHM41_15285 [Chloroflexota bacterium]
MRHYRLNWFFGIIAALLVTAAIVVPLVGRIRDEKTIILHGRMAESGGWTPTDLRAQVGKPLHLRLTSGDVMHSFAVGQNVMAPVEVVPGEFSEVTLTFDRPGKYTFYCTRWCGLNHWRMRGVIEVSGEQVEGKSQSPPLYAELGIDIDKPHPSKVTPAAPPSALEGERLLSEPDTKDIPLEYKTQEYYRAASPVDIWQDLRSEGELAVFSDQQIWNLTAALLRAQTAPEMLATGKRLYFENCAACHGESGGGDGVFADDLTNGDMPGMNPEPGHTTSAPVDFTNPETMLGASPALLQGKILRGGMGTGMPYFGPIFTEEQTWALVAYIQSFIIEMENQP